MALEYYKVLNAETKQQIDLLHGVNRLSVLKKVEHKMNDYRHYNKANIVQLVRADDEYMTRYHNSNKGK